jgi:hypothetical protein
MGEYPFFNPISGKVPLHVGIRIAEKLFTLSRKK